MTRYLFAYGTLLPDAAPAGIAKAIGRMRRLGAARVPGSLYDLGGYPGAKLDPKAKTKIRGVVFELPDDPEFLRQLDRYEEYDPRDPSGSLFTRERKRVELEGAEKRSRLCWIYVFNREPRAGSRVAGEREVAWKRPPRNRANPSTRRGPKSTPRKPST
jgi:gamma-glutamylcyclotransferase (GGCT)/AIG2-like uncharacterized protein YtfP